ncbi:hypothetical protein [Pseudanabaena sp. PCC 6802]|uniref:hypothetical protein n=1 Tax=Pseudanabaena sp. PCC 6802 TaxID=118173 RepID=UPI00034C980F|nr:hypothetical protein [Pseudanabaena sp. PCC 6802]
MQTVNHSNSQATTSKGTARLPQIAYVPLLQTALSSLDTSLDEELERYRYWLENGQTFSYLNPFKSSFGVGALQPVGATTRNNANNSNSASAIAASDKTADRNGTPLQLPKVPSPPQSKLQVEQPEITQNVQIQDARIDDRDIDTTRDVAQQGVARSNLSEQMAETIIDPPLENPDIASSQDSSAEADDLFQQFFAEVPADIADENHSHITDNYTTKYEADENEDDNPEELDSDRLENYLEELEEDELEEDDGEEYEEESEASDEPRFNLFGHLSVATLLILLAASSAIGYAMLDPTRISRILKPEQAKPSQSETPTTENTESDPNLKPEPNPIDRDTLLAVPKKDSKLVPFVPLPGKQSQPGQSVKGFTTANPNHPLDRSSDRKSAPNLSIPPLSPNKAPRLSTPTALPPAILPYQSESTPLEPVRKTNTYVPPIRDTYVPPVRENRNNYVPPVRDTYTPPARPAPVYKSAPEPRPQVNTTPAVPRPRWKRPANSLPSATSPAKTAGITSPTPITPQALPPLKSSPTVGLPPVRYTAPISAAPSDANSSSNVTSAPVAPAPVAPAPAKSAGYKIVAPTRYLTKVQEIDKEAYVRPSGEVQLGAYQNSKAAQQRADELRRQGIPVQVEQQ